MQVKQIDGKSIGGTQAVAVSTAEAIRQELAHSKFLERKGQLRLPARNAYDTRAYKAERRFKNGLPVFGTVAKRFKLWKAA